MVTFPKLIPGQTEFDAADLSYMIAVVEAQTLAEYAVTFGGLVVSDASLTAYKAEYIAKLTAMLALAVATGNNVTLAMVAK